jgi:mono/diheme cytochrome c family protein
MKPAEEEVAETNGPVNYGSLSQANYTEAKAIYQNNCVNCHGENGNRGLGGAARLSDGNLTKEQTRTVIAQGRGAMVGYQDKLSAQEMDILTEYVITLRK